MSKQIKDPLMFLKLNKKMEANKKNHRQIVKLDGKLDKIKVPEKSMKSKTYRISEDIKHASEAKSITKSKNSMEDP